PRRRKKQRITTHHRLYALKTINEVENYTRPRLQVAGYDGPEIFNKEAIEAIWHYSSGTPRLINIICDNALATACEAAKKRVSAYMVMKAASGLLLERGMNVSKSVPENGSARVKAVTARIHHRKPEAPGMETKKADEFQVSSVAVQEGGKEPTAAPHFSSHFFKYMPRLATAAMGPMAHLVIRDQIS